METDVHFSAAAIDLNGARLENHTRLWWEKDPITRFNALTQPAALLPSPGLRVVPLAPLPAAAVAPPVVAFKPPKTALDPTRKPPYAPTIAKWYRKGGMIEQLNNGDWKYTDWEHNSVVYEGEFPNFGPHERQQVDIPDMQGNCTTDYIAANRLAPKGKILKNNTWHHHQNLRTMQEVPEEVHARFTHFGARSIIKAQNSSQLRASKTSKPSKINRKGDA
ncbi:HNH endonuclease [Hymenobacter sp. BT186]|uniref:HNH endonuclease n=1 Tax=Hymenobacter telluris TaxID=2816474 RepID=A0A939EVZ8_9BACT|nr:HNH endonuclease [Hymenobacter telluris]MBO0358829.1 HNH endonuclease [Hymenobacter telluris]MBW3374855.1 HNH endonuclease [Hymenobacter norwichensis]